MTATAKAAAVYQALLEQPGDTVTMQVLADALEEAGNTALANAYRWAAQHDKWPFIRHEWRTGREVCDWDREDRDWDTFPGRGMIVPPAARLPRTHYDAIRKLPDRRYGDVNDAFVLLAAAIEALRNSHP